MSKDNTTRRGSYPARETANRRGPGGYRGARPITGREDPNPRPASRRTREQGERREPRYAHPSPHPVPPAVQDRYPGNRPPVYRREGTPRPEPEALPENLLVGRNPIREALKSGEDLEKLLVQEGEISGSAREIVARAREAGVVVQFVSRSRLDAIYKNHQGMLAYASAHPYRELEDLFENARQKGEDPFFVVLDGITDPHNLGAIIRSAECMGAHGVILPRHRSAGLNPAAVKAAAGALSYVPVCRVVNLTRTLEELKEKGLWITGAAADGIPVGDLTLTGPIALVIGAEGEGISQLVRRACDQLAALPLYGRIESLNASVAAGILLEKIAAARHGNA